MKKIIISLIVIASVVAGSWYLLSSRKDGSSPVALVNGEVIYRSELDSVYYQILERQGLDSMLLTKEVQTEQRTQALDILISQVLLRQAVESYGVTIPQEKIDTQMNVIKAQFEDATAYGAALVAEGLTEATLAIQVERDLATETYLNEKIGLNVITATNAEVEEGYLQAIEGVEDAPALEEVRNQVKEFVIGQKKQVLIAQHVQELRALAEIEILI